MKQAKLVISGRVQGVFFREFIKKSARRLKLTGFVRNLPDGNIEVMAEGSEEELNKFIAECRKGPLLAHVENIDVDYAEPEGEFDNFYVRP